MGLQTMFFLAIYFAGLIATFYRPIFGVYTYIFHWHNHPPYYWWGSDLPDLRWSMLIAVATMLSFLIHREKMTYRHEPTIPTMPYLILFAANAVFVSYFFAVLPDDSMEKAVELVKMCVMYALIISIVRTKEDYEHLIMVIVFCVAKMGFTAWEVGGNRDIGVLAPNATEENAISAHVASLMPFFMVKFVRGNRWQKLAVAAAIPFCLNLLILANSRAAIVGLLAIGALSVILFKGKARFGIIATGILMSLLFTQLTNEKFTERQNTDVSDNSAQSRLYIWSGGWEMLKDHPMGVGGAGFVYLSLEYCENLKGPKSQHNTFVAVITDWGWLGMIFYLAFLIVSYKITMQVKWRGKFHPALERYRLDSTAVQLALVGFAGAGLFHSRQYAEAVYWVSAFGIMQFNTQKTEIHYLENGLDPFTGLPPEKEIHPVSDETVLQNGAAANVPAQRDNQG